MHGVEPLPGSAARYHPRPADVPAVPERPLTPISALLDAGADPNARHTPGGFTPLHYAAAFHDHTDNAAAVFAVPRLLSAGADPNACVAPQ